MRWGCEQSFHPSEAIDFGVWPGIMERRLIFRCPTGEAARASLGRIHPSPCPTGARIRRRSSQKKWLPKTDDRRNQCRPFRASRRRAGWTNPRRGSASRRQESRVRLDKVAAAKATEGGEIVVVDRPDPHLFLGSSRNRCRRSPRGRPSSVIRKSSDRPSEVLIP